VVAEPNRFKILPMEGTGTGQLRTAHQRPAAALLAMLVALAACSPKTNVSATGNVPAQYNHVYLTAQQIWFNSSATAGPDDDSWQKFPLSAPITVDLFNASDGAVARLSTALGVSAGSYAQLRLIPVDSSAALTSSASALGARFNAEVDYTDSAGVTHQSPLELQSPDKGIGIAASFTIGASVNTSTTLIAAGSATTGGTTQTDTGFFTGTLSTGAIQAGTASTGTTILGSTQQGSATTGTLTTAATSSTTLTPLTIAINIDTARDLAFFNYSGKSAILMSPHASAYNTAGVGAIQGSISLSALPGVTSSNGHLPIEVTAELLSTDRTRHVVVNSAAVTSNGSFVLYPLPTGSSSTTYDLVIHGSGITTVIVRAVPVRAGDPTTTTPVSIGTIAPRAAGALVVNLSDAPAVPAGALIGFYQTLPLAAEVPYLIEERPIDPFSRKFATDQALSAGALQFGTFVSGAAVALTAVTPVEGTSAYRAAVNAPLFAPGELSGVVGPAPVTPVVFALPIPPVASGASADTLSIDLSLSTPGKYNAGQLLISRGGAIVATTALDTVLAQAGGGIVALDGLPGGSSSTSFAAGLYDVSVRTWNTADPAGTLNRETYPAPADLRNGSVSGYSIKID
jgi:hypothetical protein